LGSGSDNGRVRVLVVAAARLYREGIAEALSAQDRFEVTGTAPAASEAFDVLAATTADVALVDLGLPGSLELVRAMRRARPECQIVALSVPEAEDEIIACAEAGVAGLVPLDASLADLEALLDSVARGETLCSPRTVAALMRHVATLAANGHDGAAGAGLTRRQRQIMELVERGLSNKEIASQLQIELPTVKNHVHNILEKMQVGRRSDAAAQFRRAQL
jgi:two-component system nitrate/nitrite response regulator NarL